MGTLAIANTKPYPVQFEIRSGKSTEPEANEIVFDGILLQGESKQIDFETFIFERSKNLTRAGQLNEYSAWIRYGSETPQNRRDHDYTEAEINSLITQFQTATLHVDLWTHEAHVIAALWYCLHYGPEEALGFLRHHIIQYNEMKGLTKVYHETMTVFWLNLVNEFLETNKIKSLTTGVNTILKLPISQKNFPLTFYSRERLFCQKAKAHWIEPDIKPLVEMRELAII